MKQLLPLLLFCSLSFGLWANNLQISNVTLTNDSTLTFSISWENSWRMDGTPPYNHDAVWLFVKKRDCASSLWSHTDLSVTTAHHTAGSPLEVYVDGKDSSSVAKGVFVRRRTDGVGNISSVSVSLRMVGLVPGQFDFRVFGIEMVNIPEGAFYLGDGGSSGSSFREGAATTPYQVTSEGAIAYGNTAGKLYAASRALTATIAADFPKGFAEVYCMKYEISQGQYVDFVNSLQSDQAIARRIVGSAASRTNVTGNWPVIVANTPHRAMGYLGWADLLAYLDWAALRPMSEFEYEKICRGPLNPVANEYAWGTSLVTDANTLVTDGTATETASNAVTPGSGLCNYNNSTVLGPMRCGYAAKPGTTRQQSGATYYGVMDMSGNVCEQMIHSYSDGQFFTGDLGDGEISVAPNAGHANNISWARPEAANASSTAPGRMIRGGSYYMTYTYLRVAERYYGSTYADDGTRLNYVGGRGVR
ncbi:SUMF1/EgtB/PvdO family nonheme iron enzyme [Saprospira sp. CCB-QB6]|uniref:SUMF1/EgtB/PvdO family nonheme iron enzyme n=1 Tax=Saprospira sp. CCB-QB6 TaxID=3023936 RepID=UPI00234A14BB|nr:SUMF1/EgtB/PvdO family nonheme iron enzyme [Saprospira sp. CCB-QB6]WCL80955.1 SUMF1/EgtB/PvdO family nonheme iron enzyme [Saprospira sp. CCB-QB6]